MNSKVLFFEEGYFKSNRSLPLTPLMIIALKKACERQHKGIAFGPNDIKGSFTALITRGLIIRKEILINNHIELAWQVSAQAIQMLRLKGIKILC